MALERIKILSGRLAIRGRNSFRLRGFRIGVSARAASYVLNHAVGYECACVAAKFAFCKLCDSFVELLRD